MFPCCRRVYKDLLRHSYSFPPTRLLKYRNHPRPPFPAAFPLTIWESGTLLAMSTSSTTHEPDADASIPGSDELTDIEKQRPISTESLTKEEKLASDLAIAQVPVHDSIFDEEYPDGGFRAWLIVFGVSTYPLMHESPPSRTMSIQLAKHKFFFVLFRQCATLLQRWLHFPWLLIPFYISMI